MKKKRFALAFILSICFLLFGRTEIHAEDVLENQYTNPYYKDVVTSAEEENGVAAYGLEQSEIEYTSDLKKAAEEFREHLVNRENEIKLYYHSNETVTSESFNSLTKQLFDLAVEHTGKGNEGDYILWHCQGWQVQASWSGDEKNGYDMGLIYTVNYLSDADQEAQVDQTEAEVLQSLDLTDKTDEQKVKAIYDYICSNVSYDYTNLNDDTYSQKYTAYAALIDKTAVCQGYASLFYRMSLDAGVDCRVISGDAGGPHAWNIVKLGDKYYNLDSTWDAGREEYSYFLKTMPEFTDHTRDDVYKTSSFMKEYPMAGEEETATDIFFVVDDVKYHVLSESTVAVWDATNVSGTYEIPSQVTYDNKNYSVVEIGSQAFYENTKLTSVIMPDTVTKIQDGNTGNGIYGAFGKCTSLKTVTFSKNLTYIGNFAFYYDAALENVTLPEKLESIMEEAFDNCSGITKLELPVSTTCVGQYAFGGTSLSEFTVPKTCKDFHFTALKTISTLTAVYVEEGQGDYCSVDGIMYSVDMSWLEFYPEGKKDKEYRLPDQVQVIRAGAIFNNKYLKKLIMNSCIDESGLGTAILQKTNISSIEVPEDNPYLKSVDGVLFSKDGKSLLLYPPNKTDSIYFIPSGTVNIGSLGMYTFEDCKNLEELYIPSSVENFEGIMWKSAALKQVVFASESKLTSIPGYVFQECKSLETICLPASIQTFSDDFYGNEFLYCENLRVLYAAPGAGIYNCDYFGCQTLSGCTNLTVYGEGSSNALSKLAEEWGRPYQDVSQVCDRVLGITFKDTIQSVTEGKITSLNTVVYPKIKADEQLTYTSSNESIATVDSNGNVKGIKAGVCYITATSKDGAYARCQVQVQEAHKHTYVNGICTGCGKEEAIAAQGSCGEKLTWKLDNEGVLTVSGTGRMKNYPSSKSMPWYNYADQVKKIVLEKGVTSVGDFAFYGLKGLTEINLPKGFEIVGDYSFKNCISLEKAELPKNAWKIGESAFYGCQSLKEMNMPDSITVMGAYAFKGCERMEKLHISTSLVGLNEAAFYGCSSLKEITVPDAIKRIDGYVFKNCSGLTAVNLSPNLTKLGESAFYGCSSLQKLEIPKNVTVIGGYTFKNCTSLKSVTLPSELKRIGEAAFYGCYSLENLAIPKNVTEISSYAFRKCSGLKNVEFSAELTTIGESAFYGCESIVSLALPEKLVKIGAYAFKNCTGVLETNLPESLETLGESAFYGCTGMKTIVIPCNVKTIKAYAFSRCTALTDIEFRGDAPAIGDYAFSKVKANVYYPMSNKTWTQDIQKDYGGSLIWKGKNL